MSAVLTTNEGRELRRLIPLNTLPESRMEQICSEIKIEEAAKGSVLFHQGDPTHDFVYLLSGSVSLQAGGVEMDSVSGGSDVSRFALAHQNPRKVSAVAKTQVRFVRVSPNLINQRAEILHEPVAYQVSEAEEDSSSDWMSSLLRSPIFLRLPPANLQAILRNIEEVNVKSGDVIIRQDDEGDYFYIIKQGRCSLTRKPSPNAKDIRLGNLKACDTFGEDALLSGKPRTVTITMDTDGELLRLDKANFLKLVRDPIISRLTASEAQDMVHQGGTWLDVRLPDLYQQSHPRGSCINAPFFSLRMMLPSLDREKTYVAVCEDGSISEAAAYLLMRFRFNAHVLKGGLPSLPVEALISEAPPAKPEPEVSQAEAGTAPKQADPPAQQAVTPSADPEATSRPEPAASAPKAQGDEAEPGRASTRRSDDLRNVEARLSRLMAAKEKSDAELQQAKQAVHRLEMALQALRRDHDQLLEERSRTPEAAVPLDQEAEAGLQRQLDELKARYAEVLFQKETATEEAQSLHAQVKDLKALVEEFLEEQGEFALSEEAEALRAELEMVREQAGSELAALRSLLGEADAEKVRLRAELQSIRTQLSVREAIAGATAADEAGPPQPLAARLGWALAAGLLLTALVLGGLFGLPMGRDLARAWVCAPAAPEVPN